MRLSEAVLFEENRVNPEMMITEEMLTEAFIEDTLKPKLKALFQSKAEKAKKNKKLYQQKMRKYKDELNALGVDADQVTDIAERKARAFNPSNPDKSTFTKQWSEMIDEIKEKGFRQLTVPILTIIATIFVNTVFFVIFALTFGPQIAPIATAILIAPVTEEISRFISVKRRDGGRFNIIFNITEYSLYMLQAVTAGISIPLMAVARLLPVMMHTFVTAITRNELQSGTKVPLKASLLHAFYNATLGMGVIPFLYVGAEKDESDKVDNTEILVIGTNGSFESNRDAEQEVIARGYESVYVQDTLEGTFGAETVAASVFTVSKDEIIDEIKRAREIEQSVFIIDNEILTTRNKIQRFVNSDINFEVIKSEEGQIDS